MLVDILLIVLVFAFAALALIGHVLMLAALLTPAPDAPKTPPRKAGPAEMPSILRFPVTAG
jgi:hypothetical protein